MRIAVLSLGLVVAVHAAAVESASAQSLSPSPVPEGLGPDDVDEVEDVVEDSESLPRSDSAGEGAITRDRVAAIEAMQAKELALSNDEERARRAYGVGLSLGTTRPWLTYAFDAYALISPAWTFGMYAGGGRLVQPGEALSQTYDLQVETRAFGLSGRRYFQRLDGVSLEMLLGYAGWEGKLSPQGSDAARTDDTEKLSAGFTATGVVAGLGLRLDWVFANGFALDWLVVGARVGHVLTQDLTRDSAASGRAVKRDLERGALYGLTNIRVDYLF